MKNRTGSDFILFVVIILMFLGIFPALSETGVIESKRIVIHYDNDEKAFDRETKTYTREELEKIFRNERRKSTKMIMMLELIDFVCLRYNGYGEPYGIVRIDDGSYGIISFFEGEDYRVDSLCMLNAYKAADLFEEYISGGKKLDKNWYELVKPYYKLVFGDNWQTYADIPFYDGVFTIAEFTRSGGESIDTYCKLLSYDEIAECLIQRNYVGNDFLRSFDIGFNSDEPEENDAGMLSKDRLPESSDSSAPDLTVLLGCYEQDGDTENGKEPIEWIVLNSNDKGSLLISKYALDAKAFDRYGAAGWEESEIREWLNGEFYNTAFSDEERKEILNVEVENRGNPYFPGTERKPTTDSVFLLSAEEAEDCFIGLASRICRATEYAKSQGLQTGENDECWWWLRTPGDWDDSTLYVLRSGAISKRGQWNFGFTPFRESLVGVRPVIVIRNHAD